MCDAWRVCLCAFVVAKVSLGCKAAFVSQDINCMCSHAQHTTPFTPTLDGPPLPSPSNHSAAFARASSSAKQSPGGLPQSGTEGWLL